MVPTPTGTTNCLATTAWRPNLLIKVVSPPDTEDLWMAEPSAACFALLAAGRGELTEGQSGDNLVIEYQPQLPAADASRPQCGSCSA